MLLQKDNDRLRGQIVNMCSAQQPIHDENWFILQFNEIGMDIESWVVKESPSNPSVAISVAEQEALVAEISAWGEMAGHAAEMLGDKLAEIYQNRRKRIPLIRHVVAILLFEGVFDMFTFGFHSGTSDYFKKMELCYLPHDACDIRNKGVRRGDFVETCNDPGASYLSVFHGRLGRNFLQSTAYG